MLANTVVTTSPYAKAKISKFQDILSLFGKRSLFLEDI